MADVIGDAPTAPGPAPRVGPRAVRWHRRPRWSGTALVVVALVLLGYVVTHPAGATNWSDTTEQISLPPPEPPPLIGRPGLGPPGQRVLLTGSNPLIVDLGTGSRQPLTGIPGTGRSEIYVMPMPGGMIAHVSDRESVRAYLLRPGRPPRLVSRTGFAMPAADGRSLIVFEFAGSGRGKVVGQTLDGTALWSRPAPPDTSPIGDTRHGTLLQTSDGDRPDGTQPLLLVRRETGRPIRQFTGWPVAIGEDHVAHVRQGCDSRCALTLTRLDTGATQSIPLPAEPAGFNSGLFSPGDRWLVLAYPALDVDGGPSRDDEPTTLAVLDSSTGTLSPVPGVAANSSRSLSPAWSTDGQSLIVAARQRRTLSIGVWRPDRPRDPVTVLPDTYPATPSTGLVSLP